MFWMNLLRKIPKTFSTIDTVLASVGKGLVMVQAMMFPQPLQRVVAPKGVGVVDRALPGFLPDDGRKVLFGHMLHHNYLIL